MIRGLTSEEFRKICVELVYRMGFNVKSTAQRDYILAINATYRVPGEDLNYIVLFIDKKTVGKEDLSNLVDLSLIKIKYLIITTGRYDEEAIRFAKKHDIVLVDEDGFRRMLVDYELWERVEKSREHLREERKLPSSDLFDQYIDWAKNFYSEGKYKKAIEYSEKALALKESYEATLIKIKSFIALGNYLEAETMIRDFIEKGETSELWYLLGEVLEKRTEIEGALRAYTRALELDPTYYNAWVARGKILQQKNNLEEALLCYEKALKINRNMPEIWNSRGIILKELNRLDEAVKCFEIAYELDKNYLEPLYNKAIVYFDSGKFEECLKILEDILTKNPTDYRIYYTMARCYEALENYEKAKELAEKALGLNQMDENLKKYIGEIQKKMRSETCKVEDFETAVACFNLDIEFVAEKDSMALFVYGSKLYYEKKYEDALRVFQELLIRGTDTRFNIAACKSALQRNIEAMSIFIEVGDYARAYLSSKKIGRENDVKKLIHPEIAAHLL